MRADEDEAELEEPEVTGMETDKGIDIDMAEEMAGRPGVVGTEL